jgi:hypothetical protein
MDIERQNFLKEIEAETKKNQALLSEIKDKEVTNEVIDALFCEACKRFGTTLKKLAEN